MGKTPTSIPAQKGLEDKNVNKRKCSFTLKSGCLVLILMALGLLIFMYLAKKPDPGTSIVDNMIKTVKENSALAILSFVTFPISVIYITLHFIASREMRDLNPKSDVDKTIKILWIRKANSVLVVILGFACLLLGQPNVNICLGVIFGVGLLVASLLGLVVAEYVYKIEIFPKI